MPGAVHMTIMLLSSHRIELSQFSMPAMNFDQQWRYPSSDYVPYLCAIRVSEAVELLKHEMDDVFFALRQDVEEKLRARESITEIESKLVSAQWPDWRSMPASLMAQVLAQDCSMEILLKLEAKYSSGRPVAQLR